MGQEEYPIGARREVKEHFAIFQLTDDGGIS